MSTTMRGAGAGWPSPTDLTDSQLELDVERVERALAWQRCKERVYQLAKQAQNSLDHIAYPACVRQLLSALDELERLEEAGGAS